MSVENGNGRKNLNNAQRKALAEIVHRLYEKKIQYAKDESGVLVEEIRSKVKRELGYSTLQNQIEALENQIEVLKKKQQDLGFNSYGEFVGKAKILLEERTTRIDKVTKIEEERDKALASIWTVHSVDEAQKIVNKSNNG